jgi:hydrogenase maturation factor
MPGPAPHCRPEEHCITCGDEGKPVRVVRVEAATCLAICENEHGGREDVAIELVGPLAAGDRLLVHAGVALTRLEPAT